MYSRDHTGLANLGTLFLVLSILGGASFGIVAISELLAAFRADYGAGVHWIAFWTYLLLAIGLLLNGFIIRAVLAWMYDRIRLASSMNESLARLAQGSRPAPAGSGASTASHPVMPKSTDPPNPEGPHIEATPWGGWQCSECYRNIPSGSENDERCPNCGVRFTDSSG